MVDYDVVASRSLLLNPWLESLESEKCNGIAGGQFQLVQPVGEQLPSEAQAQLQTGSCAAEGEDGGAGVAEGMDAAAPGRLPPYSRTPVAVKLPQVTWWRRQAWLRVQLRGCPPKRLIGTIRESKLG